MWRYMYNVVGTHLATFSFNYTGTKKRFPFKLKKKTRLDCPLYSVRTVPVAGRKIDSPVAGRKIDSSVAGSKIEIPPSRAIKIEKFWIC
jgi:hypothetical protein